MNILKGIGDGCNGSVIGRAANDTVYQYFYLSKICFIY